LPTPKDEIRPTSTGIPQVDAELKRREPFPDAETAEVTAARLLSVWRMLQPGSGDAYAAFEARQRRRADRRR
jgi:hypothetical protein